MASESATRDEQRYLEWARVRRGARTFLTAELVFSDLNCVLLGFGQRLEHIQAKCALRVMFRASFKIIAVQPQSELMTTKVMFQSQLVKGVPVISKQL